MSVLRSKLVSFRVKPWISRELSNVTAQLEAIYASASVTVNGRNYSGEAQVQRVMTQTERPLTLLRTWTSWRNAVGPPSRPLYRQLVHLVNTAARNAGTAHVFSHHFHLKGNFSLFISRKGQIYRVYRVKVCFSRSISHVFRVYRVKNGLKTSF